MEIDHGFGFQLDKTLKKIITVYIKQFENIGIDLSIEQWVILQSIYNLGEKASQVEISKTRYRNRATTSRVISGLERKGLIRKERFEGDQKRFRLVITPEGTQLVEKALPIVYQLREVGKENIHEEEFNTFLKVLDQLWANYEAFEKSS
ncbi:MAG: MarR family transcriptional regulator [Bacteroidota bacterium]